MSFKFSTPWEKTLKKFNPQYSDLSSNVQDLGQKPNPTET